MSRRRHTHALHDTLRAPYDTLLTLPYAYADMLLLLLMRAHISLLTYATSVMLIVYFAMLPFTLAMLLRFRH